MNEEKLCIRLSFVSGLRDSVLKEISQYSDFIVTHKNKDSVYIDYFDNFNLIKKLRSVSRVYVVLRGPKCNPLYISNHKSLLGNLVENILSKNEVGSFQTFRIFCAGSDSKEVKEINSYIENTFKFRKALDADLKIHIIKTEDLWEVGIQITARPLSVRDYKVVNMSGAMDPTIAYSMNSLCDLENVKSYLNIFSGSGTLLIEAGLSYQNIDTLIGFDKDKEHLSLCIQNIKKAGLIKKIKVEEFDIFDNPDLEKFDVITSDLPFGMAISKNEDLEKLYNAFINYSQEHLNINGKVAVYTSEFELLEKIISKSNFEIVQEVNIKFITSEEHYLSTKILVLGLVNTSSVQ